MKQHRNAPTWPVTPAVRYVSGRSLPVVLPYIYGEAQPGADAPANSPTITEAVRLCEKAVAEAWRASKEAGGDGREVSHTMKLTWLACLPPLDCVHNVRIYVALVSWAMVQRIILHAEVKSYAYMAQVAMQAMNHKGGQSGSEPTEG